MTSRSRLFVVGITLLALYCTASADQYYFFDTPGPSSNSTGSPISYQPQCDLCDYNCTSSTSCCGGYLPTSQGNTSYMCQSTCLASNMVCCGCNEPLPGQNPDPNILCVSCPKSNQCYYNPNAENNIRYYCVSSASQVAFNALFIIAALFLTGYSL